MRVDGNYGATKGYEPNSYGEWKDSPHMKEPPLKASGNGEIYNYNEREYDDDYYSQPGDLFRLMPADEQQLLFENTARAMGDSRIIHQTASHPQLLQSRPRIRCRSRQSIGH